jgi:hypothetical protein
MDRQNRKNTRIAYHYTDADGYSTSTSVVLEGELSDAEIDSIVNSLDDGEFFIPSQVGLIDLQAYLQTHDVVDNHTDIGHYDPFGENGSDHVWHTIDRESFERTTDDPTVGVTTKQLIASFKASADNWGVEKAQSRIKKDLFEGRGKLQN